MFRNELVSAILTKPLYADDFHGGGGRGGWSRAVLTKPSDLNLPPPPTEAEEHLSDIINRGLFAT